MVGLRSDVGVRLQSVCPIMIRHHCINHRLALACGDANETIKYISTVKVVLRQVWKWLENPKRAAAFVKACTNFRSIKW